MPLSLEEQFETANAVTLFARLFALDRVRTDYLQRAEQPIPDQDMRVLSDLSDAMDHLLLEAEERARYLADVIAEHPEELQESYERILSEDNELTRTQKRQIRRIIMRHGGISEYGRTSAYEIMETASIERETLAVEMADIRRGGFAAGDLSIQFLCALAVGCFIGGVVSPPPQNIIGMITGVLVYGHVIAIGEDC
jgi:hypothetical protein